MSADGRKARFSVFKLATSSLLALVSCALLAWAARGLRGGRWPADAGALPAPSAAWNGSLVNPVLYMNDYRPLDYAIPEVTLARALQITAGNLGNMVWMHGASVLLRSPSSHSFIRSSLTDPNIPGYGAKVLFLPVANIFPNVSIFERGDRSVTTRSIELTTSAVKAVQGPTLLLGAGSQGAFTLGQFADLEPGTVNRNIDDYHFHKVSLDLLQAISDQGGYIMARGDYTTSILRAHGFKRVISAGCPSLFSNPNPGLGATIASKLADLKQRLDDGLSMRLAITLPPYFKPRLTTLLLRVLSLNPENRLVIQDERDMKTLARAKKLFKRFKIPEFQLTWFTSVAAWEEAMSYFDFVISGRIHGMMASLASAVPGLIIVPDMRVKELAEVMKIPHTTPFQQWLRDIALWSRPAILRGIVDMTHAHFDGAAFDRNRCALYRNYEHVFRELRLEINPELSAICGGFS